jgi:hypothetical protein
MSPLLVGTTLKAWGTIIQNYFSHYHLGSGLIVAANAQDMQHFGIGPQCKTELQMKVHTLE